MNEVGFFTLAGQPESPRELIDEVQQAEALGLGACFISERFNIKEAATLSPRHRLPLARRHDLGRG